jgi:ethanolamine ammonia-lyase large subunit
LINPQIALQYQSTLFYKALYERNGANMEQEKAYEDLMTIRSFMEEGRRRFKDNGFYFIYWGLVIPLTPPSPTS